MAKVLTFSRVFPAYHPKAGEPTYFVEKIWESMWEDSGIGDPLFDELKIEYLNFRRHTYPAKYHTIRAGKRWIAGDTFSPRVWSGKPYNSKQIIIATDIKVKHIWDFDIKDGYILLNGRKICNSRFLAVRYKTPVQIAANDGLTIEELLDWFQYPKDFSGQIICWSDDVQY